MQTSRRSIGGMLLAWLVLGLGLGLPSRVAAIDETSPSMPGTQNPHGPLQEQCNLCHGAAAWKPAKISDQFNHGRHGFALGGAHAATPCLACHTTLEFRDDTPRCASCHQDVHLGELGSDCARCHTDRSFADARGVARVHALLGFSLEASHAGLECTSCHAPALQGRSQFTGTDAACLACHVDDYQAAKAPNHSAAGFPQRCDMCHTTTAWSHATFEHDATRFALTGAHVSQNCNTCHSAGVFDGLAADCASCHIDDYSGATEPAHAAAGFSQTCQTCHSTATWDAPFDHNTTSFPLTGAHVAQGCNTCHSSGTYDGLATNCASCHIDDYNGTAEPAHAAAGFPQACQTCHTTANWDASFDHNATSFALTGAHVSQNCNTCHSTGVFDGLATACASCHIDDYNGTAEPAHAAAGFPQTCQTCHSTANWDASFDHNATSFALTGAHVSQNCNTCHSTGVFDGLATACASCHIDDYNGTAEPAHAAAGFPQTCQTCHSTANWDASLDHSTTSFALTGAHVSQNCNTCHSAGVFDGLATDCASCHIDDFDATTDPIHSAAGFPQTCQTCHTTTMWAGATFNHDANYFPIYSGRHSEEWNSCSDCHANPTNYSVFSCLGCHPHSDRTETDSHHREEPGYVYQSQACYSCHPQGRS